MQNNLKNKNTYNLENFLQNNSSWTKVCAENQKFLSDHDQLIREYKFSSRRSSYEFAYAILKLAEEYDHDPILIAEWQKVTLIWSTHSEKAVTDLDIKMASHSDEIYNNLNRGN
jgi:pterin-4a-carbinolamine dehydratase